MLMEPPAVGSPHHGSAPPDFNFNSPHHHSSQDGSFIQDEAGDMQLIMEWRGDGGGGGATLPRMGDKCSPYVPTSVLSSSWLSRAQAAWGHLTPDLDANLPDLDKGPPPSARNPADSTGEMDASFWEESPIAKDWNQNLKESVLELSLSTSKSLFSSEELGGLDSETGCRMGVEEMLAAATAAGSGFISTDSLDMSALMEDGELEAACATRKRDYMLTFEGACKSAILNSTMDYYADAALTDASDQVHPERLPNLPEPDHVLHCGVTTWGRIRRSCQLENLAVSICGAPTAPKSHSLPNLSRSPLPSLHGAGENMLSDNEHARPIYDLRESMSSSQYRHCFVPNGMSGDGLSLLRMFQNKLTTKAAMEARDQQMLPSQESSGYFTGEQQHETITGPSTEEASSKEREPETVKTNFAQLEDNQDPNYQPTTSRVEDYEYSEFYVNGRYIDVNHNEIGFTPPTQTPRDGQTPSGVQDRWLSLNSPRINRIAPTKPPRTFATLLETHEQERDGRSVVMSDASTSPPPVRPSSSVSLQNLRESCTQVPVYVVDQSVQTSCWDNGRLVKTLATASTTAVWSPSNPSAPVYTRSASDMSPRDQKVGKGPLPSNVDLSFLQLGFSPPALFPGAPTFPLSLLSQSKMEPELVAEELAATAAAKAAAAGQSRTPVEERLPEEREELESKPWRLDLGPPLGVGSYGALPSMPSFLARARGASQEQQSAEAAATSQSPGSGARKTDESGAVTRGDSGLGSSGPSHIQDWDSLAALLPKEVVSTCSFFKANNALLNDPENNIDKPRSRFSRFGRRGSGGKSSRPLSEPSFERWRRLVPKTIYESILEEGECAGPDGHTCGRPVHTCYSTEVGRCQRSHSCLRPGPTRLSVSYIDSPRAYSSCCPHVCHHSCHGCQCHGCGCGAHGRPPLPRWSAYRRGRPSSHYSGDEESQSELDLCSSGWSSEEDERISRKRPRPTSLRPPASSARTFGNRRARSSNCVRDELESSFLRGDSVASSPKKMERGRSDLGVVEARRQEKVCATCFRVRSPSEERPPLWALKELNKLPDYFECSCETSDVLEELERDARRRRRNQNLVFFLSGLRSERMCEEEMAIRKTPLYLQKRLLVERLVSESEELVRQWSGEVESRKGAEAVFEAAAKGLVPSLKVLLSDGLLPARSIWNLIVSSSTLGPATKSIHELVSELKETDGEAEKKEDKFFNGLLDLNSLDCWLSYLALKDKVLQEHYEDGAFMRRATTAYRTLLAHLMLALQSLSLLPLASRKEPATQGSRRKANPRSLSVPLQLSSKVQASHIPPPSPSAKSMCSESPRRGRRGLYSLLPTRLPADSRVPKSSSVPSKLASVSAKSRASPSRIPVLKDSPSLPNKSAFPINAAHATRPNNTHKYVCAIDAVPGNKKRNILSCGKGETLELVGTPLGRFLRCRINSDM